MKGNGLKVKVEISSLTRMSPNSYYTAIAALHIEEIHHGVLPLLGQELLSRIYFELAVSPSSGVWVAMLSDKLVGFLAGSVNVSQSYLSVLSRAWPELLLFGLRSASNFSLMRKLLTLLIYPFQQSTLTEHSIEGCNNVNSEILSIAINPAFQRRGIGQILINAFEHKLRESNVRGFYRAATNLAEVNSNTFYKKAGFIPCHQMKHNDLTLQIYLKKLANIRP